MSNHLDPVTTEKIYYHMDKIRSIFKDAHITIYVHNPGLEDGDMVSSSENSYLEAHERMGKFLKDKGVK